MRKTGLLESISIFKPLDVIKNEIAIGKPRFILCNRTFFMVLAEYIKNHPINYSPKFLISTAEQLDGRHRKFIEESFNTKIMNVFGCMEAPTIAYSCPESNNLHVFQSTVFVEIINKQIIDGEEYGELVITNLTNPLMPFIRYKTGDLIKVIDRNCSCGRNTQIIGEIIGRNDDVIRFSDGRVFNYIHIWQRFREPILIENYDKIEQYKVWHHKKDDTLTFHFRINKKIRQAEGNKIIEKILKDQFSDVNYEFEIVDKIALSSNGKFKIIENIE